MAVQDHIHLDLPTNLSGDPENAPVTKYAVTERILVYEVFADFDRAWDGTELFASMANSQGDPAIFPNLRYTIRATQDQLSALEALHLRVVAVVDNVHVPNGIDHTPYVRQMRLKELRYVGNIDPLLQRQSVEITLQVLAPQ